MNNRNVAHLWANKSRTEARGSHFFFEGDTIYSYGRHFPIARHYMGVVLFTTQGYSVTTSKHKSYVSSASHHLTRFYVEKPERGPSKFDLENYRERIKAVALEASRARTYKEQTLNRLTAIVEEANKFAETFGFKTRFTVPSDVDLAKLNEAAKKSAALERKRIADQKAKAEELAADYIRRWLAGEDVSIRQSIDKVYLRARQIAEDGKPTGHMVMETSRGAVVPLREAKLAFSFVMTHRESGWHRNGEQFKVGDFQLDEVSATGVKAGCHFITFEEIERFAKAQGWI